MTQEIKPASSPAQPAMKSATVIAEEILGPIDWLDAAEGFCDCPGRKAHTNRTGLRDCKIYLDHVPTLHCVHPPRWWAEQHRQNHRRTITRSSASLFVEMGGGGGADLQRLGPEGQTGHLLFYFFVNFTFKMIFLLLLPHSAR